MSGGRGVQAGGGRHRGDEEEGGRGELPGTDGDQREGEQAKETRGKNVRMEKNHHNHLKLLNIRLKSLNSFTIHSWNHLQMWALGVDTNLASTPKFQRITESSQLG